MNAEAAKQAVVERVEKGELLCDFCQVPVSRTDFDPYGYCRRCTSPICPYCGETSHSNVGRCGHRVGSWNDEEGWSECPLGDWFPPDLTGSVDLDEYDEEEVERIFAAVPPHLETAVLEALAARHPKRELWLYLAPTLQSPWELVEWADDGMGASSGTDYFAYEPEEFAAELAALLEPLKGALQRLATLEPKDPEAEAVSAPAAGEPAPSGELKRQIDLRIKGPQHPVYGLHRSQFAPRLTTENWDRCGLVRKHGDGWLYFWIEVASYRDREGNYQCGFAVSAVSRRDEGEGFGGDFRTLEAALAYVNGEDGGKVARETSPAAAEDYPKDQLPEWALTLRVGPQHRQPQPICPEPLPPPAEWERLFGRGGLFLWIVSQALERHLPSLEAAGEFIRENSRAGDPLYRRGQLLHAQAIELQLLQQKLADIARISQGAPLVFRDRFDLRELVQFTLDWTRPLHRAFRSEWDGTLPTEPLWICADWERLRNVLAELVRTALYCAGSEGRVEVSVTREEDEAVVRVRNTGTGIYERSRAHFFNKLFTPSGLEARAGLGGIGGGLGIGLTLVQALIEAHGGIVTAWSDGPSAGTELEVRLPALPPGDPASWERPHETRQVGKLVGRQGQDFYICHTVYWRGEPFHGATGFVLRPVDWRSYRQATSPGELPERLRRRWVNAAASADTSLGLAEWTERAYATEGDRLLWDHRGREYWHLVRAQGYPEESFPVIECRGTSRVFGQEGGLVQFDEVYAPEVLELIAQFELGA